MIIEKRSDTLDKNLIENIAQHCNISERFAELLVSRGHNTPEKAWKFIYPSASDLHDPFLLKGMKEAVERITMARENGETVVVYGDYDADGISATSILVKSLAIFGIEANAVVPERRDGYGLTEGVIERVLDEYYPDLIITVDCGISAVKEVEELYSLGVDVIITDHHEIPEEIPNCIVVDCKIKNQDYPFDGLCGAGVSYKLSRALIGDRADAFLDMVAVATIADSMPMTDENRYIVNEGIRLIKNSKCSKALKKLAETSGLKEYSSTAFSYSITPRINAAGRMGDANCALELFLCEDDELIDELVEKINNYNTARQNECDMLYKSAKGKMAEIDNTSKVIILSDTSWHTGFLGIVANKFVEEYSKPTILFAEGDDGIMHGSARSIEYINMFKALNAVSNWTETSGGHAQAAGVTIKKEKFEEFKNALNNYINDNYDISVFESKIEVEEIINERFSVAFAKELALLEPIGIDNKKPYFAVECRYADAFPLKMGSTHISFKTPYIDLIYFNGINSIASLNTGVRKYIIFEPNISIFNGRESLKGYMRDLITVIENDEATSALIFEDQVSKYNSDTGKYTRLDNNSTRKLLKDISKEMYGTVIVANNLNNIQKFPELDCYEKSVLLPSGKGNLNCLCAGLSALPEGYKRVVYIDKPISVPVFEGAEIFVNEECCGVDLNSISVDRSVIGGVFTTFKRSTTSVISACDASMRINFNCSAMEVVFVFAVMLELGIFKKEGAYINIDPMIRADLESSNIYRQVCKLFN